MGGTTKTVTTTPVMIAMGLVVGGACGSLARLALSALQPADAAWPWVTMAINLTGAVLLGFITAYMAQLGPDIDAWRVTRLSLGTGLIGGYTTYSTLMLEVARHVNDGRLGIAMSYLLGSVIFGLGCAMLGLALGEALGKRRIRLNASGAVGKNRANNVEMTHKTAEYGDKGVPHAFTSSRNAAESVEAAGSAEAAEAAGSAEAAGAVEAAGSVGSAEAAGSSRSAESAESAGAAGLAGSAEAEEPAAFSESAEPDRRPLAGTAFMLCFCVVLVALLADWNHWRTGGALMLLVLASFLGGLGAFARYSVDAWVNNHVHLPFACGTIVVNLTACLAMGLIVGWCATHAGTSALQYLLASGFLGGYSTFSTASVEGAKLMLGGKPGWAFVHTVGMMIVGLALLLLGMLV
ncbi:CrcB family protein [Bifidobacterium sp. ESL0704]|uniref:fluoride efflux transporter FluC n=1 Tax=Bifidobacterium sp. ESL0704 TaxID=2983219 RepID=UPI0023F654F1|nr:CrcB family protein [Bifidobacterium sp. ESL0704]WEV53386.1 CrcB family protein [Bifidobacterium sp. ESL0704]